MSFVNGMAWLHRTSSQREAEPVGDPVAQGSPSPGPQTSTSPWPVRNWAAQQEVSDRRVSKVSSLLTAAPHRSHYRLSAASCRHFGELHNYFIILQCNNNRNKVHNKCNALESSRNHPPSPPVHGKIVFHKTGPWCQKGWGLLL